MYAVEIFSKILLFILMAMVFIYCILCFSNLLEIFVYIIARVFYIVRKKTT